MLTCGDQGDHVLETKFRFMLYVYSRRIGCILTWKVLAIILQPHLDSSFSYHIVIDAVASEVVPATSSRYSQRLISPLPVSRPALISFALANSSLYALRNESFPSCFASCLHTLLDTLRTVLAVEERRTAKAELIGLNSGENGRRVFSCNLRSDLWD